MKRATLDDWLESLSVRAERIISEELEKAQTRIAARVREEITELAKNEKLLEQRINEQTKQTE